MDNREEITKHIKKVFGEFRKHTTKHNDPNKQNNQQIFGKH